MFNIISRWRNKAPEVQMLTFQTYEEFLDKSPEIIKQNPVVRLGPDRFVTEAADASFHCIHYVDDIVIKMKKLFRYRRWGLASYADAYHRVALEYLREHRTSVLDQYVVHTESHIAHYPVVVFDAEVSAFIPIHMLFPPKEP